MRTSNNHPLWYNQPLRLTEEERKNPVLVINDFFECYHLKDVRDITWKWLVEVLTSSGSISNEALERNDHIFFYEKIEALIEACYVIMSQVQEKVNVIHPESLPTG